MGFGAATFLDGLVDRVAVVVSLLGAVPYLAIAFLAELMPALLAGFGLLGVVNNLQVNAPVTRMSATDPERKGATLGLNTTGTYLGSFVGTAAFRSIYSGCRCGWPGPIAR